MSARPAIRASDADRERVAERLRRAAGEGRLLTEELEERLETVFRARTYHELDRTVSDLPGRRRRHRPRTGEVVVRTGAVLVVAVVAVAAVLFIATGVVAGWLLWVVAAWWFFGARRGRHHGWHRGPYGLTGGRRLR
jgi:Flp pilus assembly protein TadB